jgi:hypothetical protein
MSNFTTKIDFLRQVKNFTGLTATNAWNLSGNTISSPSFLGTINDSLWSLISNNQPVLLIDKSGAYGSKIILGANQINESTVSKVLSIDSGGIGLNPTSGNTDSVLLYSNNIEGSNTAGLVIRSEDDYVHEFGNKVKLNSAGSLVSSTNTLLSVNGGLSLSISATTDSIVNLNDDVYTLLCDSSSSAITVNLPSFTSLRGKIIVIKKVSNNNFVTITPSIFEDIDGLSNIFLYNENDYVMLQSPGNIGGFTGWKIISKSFNKLLFTQTGNSPTITATVVETSLIDGGIGSLSVPANGFSLGDTFSVKFGGIVSAANSETLTIRIKSGSVILGSDTVTFPNTSTRPWQFYATFVIRQIGGTTVASIQSNGLYTFHNNSGTILGGGFDTFNNTTFDTTILNTLDFTVQWGSSNASNSIYSSNFYLIKE